MNCPNCDFDELIECPKGLECYCKYCETIFILKETEK